MSEKFEKWKEFRTKETGVSFDDWCADLDAYHNHLRATEEGFEGYGAGSCVENCGKEAWRYYYDTDHSAADALSEDRTYWDED